MEGQNYARTLLAMQSAGVALDTVSSFYATQDRKDSLRFQAELNRINARIAETSAQFELLEGQRRAGAVLRKGGAAKSTARVRGGSRGLDPTSDSLIEEQLSIDYTTRNEVFDIELAATRAALSHRGRAVGHSGEALVQDASSKSLNPYLSSFSTLLSGSGQVASSWYNYNRTYGG